MQKSETVLKVGSGPEADHELRVNGPNCCAMHISVKRADNGLSLQAVPRSAERKILPFDPKNMVSAWPQSCRTQSPPAPHARASAHAISEQNFNYKRPHQRGHSSLK